MSQLGYMYSKAVQQYGGAFALRINEKGASVFSPEIIGEKSVQGVGEFLYRSNYDMSLEERQAMMTSYTAYLSGMLGVNDINHNETENSDEEITNISLGNEVFRDPADIICGESIISDFSYGKHQLEYLFSYDEKGLSCMYLKTGEEIFNFEFKDESQYENVKSFLSGLDSEDNLTFTASKTFWSRFLNGDIDVDDFKYTLSNYVNNGQPEWAYTDEDGVRHSTQIIPKYMNIFGNPKAGFNISGGSLASLEKERITREQYNMQKWFGHKDEFIKYFYFLHPSEVGKKSFWLNGENKSIEEMIDFWDKEDKDKKHPRDNAEREAEKYYKEYPENRGKKLFYYEGSMYTFEEHYRLTVETEPAVPDYLIQGNYWLALDRME